MENMDFLWFQKCQSDDLIWKNWVSNQFMLWLLIFWELILVCILGENSKRWSRNWGYWLHKMKIMFDKSPYAKMMRESESKRGRAYQNEKIAQSAKVTARIFRLWLFFIVFEPFFDSISFSTDIFFQTHNLWAFSYIFLFLLSFCLALENVCIYIGDGRLKL